jgi:hypothetical protein
MVVEAPTEELLIGPMAFCQESIRELYFKPTDNP